MGNGAGKNPNIVLNNQNEDIIEYEGYEEFAIVEISNNNLKQEKLKPNPSLNNHSGGSSIGKYDSEHDIHKLKDKVKDDKKDNEESNSKHKSESKFPHNNPEQINQNEDIKNDNNENNNNINMNENNEYKDNNNDYVNNVNNNNEEKEKIEEDIKNENTNDNNIEQEKAEDKIEEQNNNIKEENENMNMQEENDKDKMQLEENNLNENVNNVNLNKEENLANEEQNQIQKEEINNNDINNIYDKNNQQDNIVTTNENKENENNNNENVENNNINNEKKNENENNKNKNEEFAPKKIVLPNINTIISEKVLEEGAGNELLFMSNLNKMVHISIKERVKYSEKFCITTKDNFLIYETRENYIKVKKPLAIIPINTIKNVVLFKLTKKVINYDHFYIEFQLDENNKNNVYNQIETFYMNDLDNNNENKGDTALVMFKTEEKNLAKKWYVLLKYLVELKSKN